MNNSVTKFLNEIKVLDLSRHYSGDLASMFLSDFGASVYKYVNNTDSYSENILLVDNDLSENQLLRAQQLITYFNENAQQIMLKIDELSQNWSFERIAKPERTALMLGIAELKMKLTPCMNHYNPYSILLRDS